MNYLSNMQILKEYFPDVWQKIAEIEGQLEQSLVQAVSSKDRLNLRVGNKYFYSKKNPVQEAKDFIEQFDKVNEYSDILFYGVGLGYHIKAFIEEYPNTPFSIYEPVPEVFCQFLHHTDLKQIPLRLLRNIYIETGPEDVDNYCRGIVNRIRSSILIMDLPVYQDLFPEKRQAFFALFENYLDDRRISLATLSAFEKRWTINSTKNFIQVVNSPNILLGKKDRFKNKPALLVASGPSLEEEIENLRRIKEKGLAYIFSVGTAINTLLQHNIRPDATCTYDPTKENQIICKEVLARGIKTIPLIFGSTVGYESLEKYPGPKFHMLISQDALAAFYLKPEGKEEAESINDATTITVIVLQLLYKLGFNPIILVGQNLAYRDRKNYADGSSYPPHEVAQPELDKAVLVRDVYGNSVPSNHSYIRMKRQMEAYLRNYQDIEVINTTKYGAHIEGTRFQSLSELMQERLLDRVVEDNWLEPGDCSYDVEHLMQQSRIMEDAFANIRQLLDKCKQDLDNINNLANSNDEKRINDSYEQFNFSMDQLRNNPFFATFITPMNRVELELLILAVPGISAERDPILKAQLMEKEFRPFLLSCERDIDSISPLFQAMNQSLQRFYSIYKVRKKAARARILLMDCDGILTDGSVYYSASGDEMKKFNCKDGVGIRCLQEKGMQLLLINPDGSPLVENAARKLGISTIHSATGDKGEIIAAIVNEYGLDREEVACIFNDTSNPALFKQVGLSFAVQDSPSAVQNEVDYVLGLNGGQGVIKELADLLAEDRIIS